MTKTHLTRYSVPYTDSFGREYTGYCGAKTSYEMYPPAFTKVVEKVDCEECLVRYALFLLKTV